MSSATPTNVTPSIIHANPSANKLEALSHEATTLEEQIAALSRRLRLVRQEIDKAKYKATARTKIRHGQNTQRGIPAAQRNRNTWNTKLGRRARKIRKDAQQEASRADVAQRKEGGEAGNGEVLWFVDLEGARRVENGK